MKYRGNFAGLDLLIALPRTSQNRTIINLRGRLVRARQAFPQRFRQQGALPRRKAQCFSSNLVDTHSVIVVEVLQGQKGKLESKTTESNAERLKR